MRMNVLCYCHSHNQRLLKVRLGLHHLLEFDIWHLPAVFLLCLYFHLGVVLSHISTLHVLSDLNQIIKDLLSKIV